MLEVFTTNVHEKSESEKLVLALLTYFPSGEINFDLEDCDKILRVKDVNLCAETIIALLNGFGYRCEILP